MAPSIAGLIDSLQLAARQSGHRRFLVCAGDAVWCRQQAAEMIRTHDDVLVVAEPPDWQHVTVISAAACLGRLGAEHSHVIFDAHSGFDVDAFGAISGTVRAGGVMVLLTPPLDQWSHLPDPQYQRMVVYPQQPADVPGHYLQRLVRLINSSNQLSILSQHGQLRQQPGVADCPQTTGEVDYPCVTACQQQAVAKIHHVVRGHRRRPLVLTADRGRGKSAALGIAAAQLLLEGVEHIAITAPAKKSTEIVFKHARLVLGEQHEALCQRLEFFAPDDLLRTLPATSLLLVDEAAAIAAPLLERMLENYSRIVYASTIHGYEGTGRGFAVRFRDTLNQRAPQWQALNMVEPVRWRANDPLEAFVFQALLLNAAPCQFADGEDISLATCTFRAITVAELLADEALLQQLFGLLVLAQYQTRPWDLRHLLDGGNILIYAGFAPDNRLLAVLLVAREGGIEAALDEDICFGRRRVRGHILPQSLSNHLGIADAIAPVGFRVIRLAVHPDCQRLGIGRRLLQVLEEDAVKQRVDYLGTIYGATDDLLHFWRAASFVPVRVGLSRDGASGTHAVMMLKPLTSVAAVLVDTAQQRFVAQFQWLLLDELKALDASVVATLLSMLCAPIAHFQRITVDDLPQLWSFTQGQRQYENCVHLVKKAVWQILASVPLPVPEARLLVQRALQGYCWAQVVENCRLSGEKRARQLLRELVNAHCHVIHPQESH